MTSPSRGAVDRTLGVAAVLAAAGATVLALVVAPSDAVQGEPQRLMYVHVPAAWLAYLSFAAVLVGSVAYLLTRDLRWDHRARAAAELGVGMTALTIALGSIWGRPVWGTWWAWDPRLVTTAVLLLVYLGYLSIRGLGDDPAAGARRAAAVGIVAFVNVPVVHFSVVWWRTLHQPATVLSPTPASMDPRMALALGAAVVAFTLAGTLVVRRRLRALGEGGSAGGPAGGESREPGEPLVVLPRPGR